MFGDVRVTVTCSFLRSRSYLSDMANRLFASESGILRRKRDGSTEVTPNKSPSRTNEG